MGFSIQVAPSARASSSPRRAMSWKIRWRATPGQWTRGRPWSVQPDLAGAVVVRHRQQHLGVVGRALVGPLDQALDPLLVLAQPVGYGAVAVLPGRRGRRLEGERHQRRQGARDRPFLDDHAVAEGVGAPEVHGARDGGPGRVNPEIPLSDADAAHGQLSVIGKAQDVAVSGEALAQPRGQRETAVAGPQQDAGGA